MPEAFAASPSDDRAIDPDYLRHALAEADQALFGGFDPELAGIVGLYRAKGEKSAHKSHLWGLYVAPAHRGKGLGRLLVEAAVGFARSMPGVSQVCLCVSEETPGAAALYQRAGFVTWGVEPDALRIGGRPVSDRHMVLKL